MYFATVALGCVLLGQTPGGASPIVPVQEPVPPANSLQSNKPAEPVQRSLLRAADAADATDAVKKASAKARCRRRFPARPMRPRHVGRFPPRLSPSRSRCRLAAPSRDSPWPWQPSCPESQDRRQQLELTHAYWRLAQAVAGYRFCFEENEQLGRLPSGGDEATELRVARASAAAALQEAEAGAVAAQHELAGLMALAADMPPPLPADRPHVGPYHTYFNELFGAGPAPDRTRLIDRVLPLRRAAIDAHAVALQACEDSLAAAREAQAAGQGGLVAAGDLSRPAPPSARGVYGVGMPL